MSERRTEGIASIALEGLAELLEAGRPVWICLRTTSMAPTLRPGDELLLAPLAGRPRMGDVLAFDGGGVLVVHRYLFAQAAGWRTAGDGGSRLDTPLPPARVLGRVVALRRDGVERRLGVSTARLRGLASLARIATTRVLSWWRDEG